MLLGTEEKKLVVIPEKGYYAIGKTVYHEGLKGLKKDIKKSVDKQPKLSQRTHKKFFGTIDVAIRNLRTLNKINHG
ncbi:hypothetical protein [Leptolyngbya phage Lbo-JY46]